jgi:hypothetical protein
LHKYTCNPSQPVSGATLEKCVEDCNRASDCEALYYAAKGPEGRTQCGYCKTGYKLKFHGGFDYRFYKKASLVVKLEDSVGGMVLAGNQPVITYGGHKCWDLDGTHLQYAKGNQPRIGGIYTHAVWLYWRNSDATPRTLFNPNHDKTCQVKGDKLGMFTGRGGSKFQDSGHSISKDLNSWQLVIVTGQGSSETAAAGTSTFFTAKEGDKQVTMQGTSDYVASGNLFHSIGAPTEGPGKVAAAYMWDRILSVPEMNMLLARGVDGRPDEACCDLPDALCLACKANMPVEEFCAKEPDTFGCPETPSLYIETGLEQTTGVYKSSGRKQHGRDIFLGPKGAVLQYEKLDSTCGWNQGAKYWKANGW